MKEERLRVAVWGPGSVGTALIREVLLLPELQLTSVLAYSPTKAGQDAGAMVGMPLAGVNVTADADELIRLKPQCVLYAARDYGDGRNEQDITRLLKAGINVITVLAYHQLQMRGEAVQRRIEDAAKSGKATLFATGVNPGFMFERLAMVMTGLSNGIQNIALSEFINCEHMPGAGTFLQLMGFGMRQVDEQTTERTATLVGSYLIQNLHYVADKIGRRIDRIEREEFHVNTDKEIALPGVLTLAAGTVARLSFRWSAYSGTQRFLSVRSVWYVTEQMRPQEIAGKGDDFWQIEIEGRPSVRVSVEVAGSLERPDAHHPANPSNLSYLVTAVPAIQAIPVVVAAAPGVLDSDAPQFHWRHDLRGA